MSAVMSPIMVGVPSLKTGGVVNSGGKIYTYMAGTTTLANTWTDNTLGVLNANPIILNSLGLAPNEIWWNSGSTMKFIVQDSAGNVIGTYDNLTGNNDPSSGTSLSEWTALGLTPTYISAVSFSVTGNQTAILQVGRRTKTTNTGGTIYSTISASSFTISAFSFGASITTVTVVNDSGTLDSGLSVVSYGLLSATNPSAPTITGQAIVTPDVDADYLSFLDSSGSAMGRALARNFTRGVSYGPGSKNAATYTLCASGMSTSLYNMIVISLEQVSLSGTNDILIQLKDQNNASFTAAGYVARNVICAGGGNTVTASTAGFNITTLGAAESVSGMLVLMRSAANTNPGADVWSITGSIYPTGATDVEIISGYLSLTSTTPVSVLDGVQLASSGGVQTFDGNSRATMVAYR